MRICAKLWLLTFSYLNCLSKVWRYSSSSCLVVPVWWLYVDCSDFAFLHGEPPTHLCGLNSYKELFSVELECGSMGNLKKRILNLW